MVLEIIIFVKAGKWVIQVIQLINKKCKNKPEIRSLLWVILLHFMTDKFINLASKTIQNYINYNYNYYNCYDKGKSSGIRYIVVFQKKMIQFIKTRK